MYKLVIEGHFDAAHCLRNYEGPCSRLHGHTWRIQLCVGGTRLGDSEMLVDFKILKTALKEILDKLDHYCVNDIAPFDKINPTAENLSKWMHDTIAKRLYELEANGEVIWIRVWESPTAYCEYSR